MFPEREEVRIMMNVVRTIELGAGKKDCPEVIEIVVNEVSFNVACGTIELKNISTPVSDIDSLVGTFKVNYDSLKNFEDIQVCWNDGDVTSMQYHKELEAYIHYTEEPSVVVGTSSLYTYVVETVESALYEYEKSHKVIDDLDFDC